MPEHFLKQLEVSQIQYIGTIIMSIGRNNWDVRLNKLENDTIHTSAQKKRQPYKCNHINPVKHGIGNQEKVSCLEQPRSNFFKT